MMNPILLTKRQLQICVIAIFSAFTLIVLRSYSLQGAKVPWPEWTGVEKYSTSSQTIVRRVNSNTTITTTESFHPGKTLWDWLDLLIIPVSIAALGLCFQSLQQQRANAQASIDKAIAENNLREEAVQAYFDRLSELLINKKLTTLAFNDPTRITSLDVIRAKTLSILRRLGNDGERKGDILQFLFDAELLTSLKVNLVNADFSGAILIGVDLRGANLEGVVLDKADLRCANLEGSHLLGASLVGANLCTDPELSKDTLVAAQIKTNMRNTDLCGAVLCGARLMQVDLIYSNLLGANLRDADIRCANLRELKVPLSIEQVKAAKNWEHAIYDPEFRKNLFL